VPDNAPRPGERPSRGANRKSDDSRRLIQSPRRRAAERWGCRKAERFRGLEVDDQLDIGGKISRLIALEVAGQDDTGLVS
jgi:hypothetical protein